MLAAAAVLALASGCASNASRVSSLPPQTPHTAASTASTSSPLPAARTTAHADYAFKYSSLNELYAHSDTVFSGRVVAADYRVSPSYDAYTVCTVHVDKVFKGDLRAGINTYVLEPGGVLTVADMKRSSGREYLLAPGDETSRTQILVDGIPLRVRGDRIIYFAKALPADAFVDKPHFQAVGPLAEFAVKGDKTGRFVPHGWADSPMDMTVGGLESLIRAKAAEPD